MRIPLRSLAVAGAAVVTLVATGPAAASTPAPSTTTDPAVGAAGWLAQQFVGADHKPSTAGDHFETSYGATYYFDGGLTADAIFGLAATKVGRTKIGQAIAYFEKHVTEYTSYGDGQIAKTALAAMVAGADPTAFGGQNLLAALAADQCTQTSNADGSDYTKPACPGAGAGQNIFSSVSESFIILTEARASATFPKLNDAVQYFLTLQCSDGGFTVNTSPQPTCTSDPDATAYATMALQALAVAGGPAATGAASALQKATDWLVGARNSAGYWIAQGGPDADTTGLAAAALAGLGKDVSVSRHWLLAQQVATGPTIGIGASRGAIRYPYGKPFNATSSTKATADALLGLSGSTSLATLTAAGAAADAPVLALPAPRLSGTQLRQGGTGSVTLGGFAAGEKVAVVAHSTPVPLGTVTADANGTASLTFTVPTTLAVGQHEITLTGETSGLSSSVGLSVLAAAAPTASQMSQPQNCGTQALACTGRDGRVIRGEAVLGGGLVLAGAGALWLGRRRRRA